MPLITVKLIEDVFTPVQKVKIIETLTDAMVAIEGENLRELTFVLIEEVKQGDWGVGGKPLTASDVHRLQGVVAA
jgi:4-oxalocrotonate tautomerase